MPLIIMKFGGSLVGNERDGLLRVAKLVRSYHTRGNRVIAVVSALGEVTDLLIQAANSAKSESLETDELLERLRKIHGEALSQLGKKRAAEVAEIHGRLFEALQETLRGVSILRELTPRSKDRVVSFGERLSAPLVKAAIEDAGVGAVALTGGEAGIITDEAFGEAYPDMRRTSAAAKKALLPPLSKGTVPVVTGFLARTRSGDVTTLGRGGSDYTATILADALRADEVYIWTDVDGIMTADPRVVPESKVIKELSYAEAEEMAYFGAKNMHPLALWPARMVGVPVRILNGFKPDLPGTLIDSNERKGAGVIKSLALVRDVGLLTVSGETLAGRPGTAAMVFTLVGRAGVNMLMISQSVSESNISMVVRRSTLERAAKALKTGFAEANVRADVATEEDLSVIAAVGAGMKGTPGVAAKVFGVVSRAGVNVKMIAQGSSELNISFVVPSEDATRALRALHSSLVEAVAPRDKPS